ncbi:MAG: response regulator transcription factor [Pseudomonadota bacterium]
MQPSSAVIFLIDDDEAVRDSLQWLLKSHNKKVKNFESAEAFLASEDLTESIGCILTDIRMPGMSGLELQTHVRQLAPQLPIILMTGHGDIPMAVQSMQNGAFDFIEKPFSEEDLIQRIHRCLTYVAEQVDEQEQLKVIRLRIADLTPRETEVMERMVQGRMNKQIADDLGISIKTVELHRARVMEKMEAPSLADLVRQILLVQTKSNNS